MTRTEFISHVKGTQGALRRFLHALCCGDSQLADDVAQETYLKAYIACESFRENEKFAAWIHRIAYHTFLNLKRGERLTTDVETARSMAADASADESFRYQDLYQALGQLSEKERTAVLLHYIEGYSVREIADVTGLSADAVKQHLSRGRRHLHELLHDKP